jgi:3-keto-disaccharide hydrolase
MKSFITILTLLVSLAAVAADPQTSPISPTTTIVLFNHRNLDGWYTFLRDHRAEDPLHVFTVKDGVIRISGEEWGGIATTSTYRDYRLVVEWKWGKATWGERKDRARDSGILVHGVGPDGAAGGNWLESIESQVIEGGAGDFILVAGLGKPSVQAEVRQEGDQIIWQRGGERRTLTEGRINWYGRDPRWTDTLAFRGGRDVERPAGEWNRQEVVARADSLTNIVNGVTVNEVSGSSHTAGKIQIQSEGAEILVRTVELHPLGGR